MIEQFLNSLKASEYIDIEREIFYSKSDEKKQALRKFQSSELQALSKVDREVIKSQIEKYRTFLTTEKIEAERIIKNQGVTNGECK